MRRTPLRLALVDRGDGLAVINPDGTVRWTRTAPGRAGARDVVYDAPRDCCRSARAAASTSASTLPVAAP